MNQSTPWHERLILQLITISVVGNGLVIIAGTLLAQLRPRNGHLLNDVVVTLPLISGITLVYLGSLLHRRKQAAWAVVVPLYAFILGLSISQFISLQTDHRPELFLRNILLPFSIVTCLIVFRRVFNVKSAIQNFSFSFHVILAMFLIILAYGTSGYLLLDQHDFHQELSVISAAQHALDQFDFTTDEQLIPQTSRATVFVDSLNIVSAVAVGYVIISLFQPLRARLTSQAHNRRIVEELLKAHSRDSEDFFKLWPNDKTYFINHTQTAALAYRVQQGFALVVGDPVGQPKDYSTLLNDFYDHCRPNDWSPVFVHVSEESLNLYDADDFQSQKIGEEAVVSCHHFLSETKNNKYFRQINNKFTKNGYTTDYLKPPHQPAVMNRLRQISDEWLATPGRQERGFMMGYFNDYYLQQCNLLVARDSAGAIQAFINQVPTFQPKETNYDLLRHSQEALGNVNDFVLMAFIAQAHQQGYQTVNLGLCPWSGLDKETEERSLIGSTMHFLYTNGNRFYSFTGLRRFKSKYEPTWRNRYVVYKGGVRSFSRAAYALNKTMGRTK